MRILQALIIMGLFFSCKEKAKSPPRTIYNSDFKWTISIPKGFDTVSAQKWEKMQNRGAEAIEKSYNTKIENKANNIFVFQSDQFNYFESNYQFFDTAVDGNHFEVGKEMKKIVYETFEAQMKGVALDSSSFTEVISGLRFQVFKLVANMPNKMVMNWYMYNRLFGNKDFTVNIMTVDKKKEKELLSCWLNSKFEH